MANLEYTFQSTRAFHLTFHMLPPAPPEGGHEIGEV